MQLNIQPPEKRDPSTFMQNGSLEVHSVFFTIQGEGPYVGRPAVFVRLAGCNLQCPQCDTDYTSQREWLTPEQLLSRILWVREAARLVVITGGEPFRQDITIFAKHLIAARLTVQVETNGTFYLPSFPYDKVTVVCSPKAGAVNATLASASPGIAAYKYVGSAGNLASDGLPRLALNHPASPMVARPPATYKGPIYLQPVDEKDEEINQRNLIAVRDSCMRHGYIMGVQLHKLIGVD